MQYSEITYGRIAELQAKVKRGRHILIFIWILGAILLFTDVAWIIYLFLQIK